MRRDWLEQIDATDIEAARARVSRVAVASPLVPSPGLSAASGVGVFLKQEGVQPTGSFKVRGAASKILALDPEQQHRGVVTASTGNHGRAVAHVAREIGIPATVCLSENVPRGKVEALHALGCDTRIGGDSQEAALAEAARLVEDEGMTLVHPFDDPLVIAGQGTLGLEIDDDGGDPATVLIPLSGGGLLAGVALAMKSRRPSVRIVGISMERAAVMAASLTAGHPVELDEEPTLADSLQGGIGLHNRFTFPMVRDLADDIVLLTEDEIWSGMQWAFDHHGLALEGGGAVGIAALLTGKIEHPGPHVVVCSGRNLEADLLRELGRHGAPPAR